MPMDFNSVKQNYLTCSDLTGLRNELLAILLLGAELKLHIAGSSIYQQSVRCDDTFAMLMSGNLDVVINGRQRGTIDGITVFGEMAFFTTGRQRTASVLAATDSEILLFHVGPEVLNSKAFKELERLLGLHAWRRFVQSSQTQPIEALDNGE